MTKVHWRFVILCKINAGFHCAYL